MVALLPILAALVPEVVRLIAGDRAGTVSAQVVDVVRTVVGSDDPDAVQAAIADPAKATELRLALARLAAEREQAERRAEIEALRAALADVGSARQQTVELARARHPMAWGAAAVSVLVLAAFGAAVWVVLTRALPAGSQEVALYTLGALQTMATAVVTYWVGSSAGSARKDMARPFEQREGR